MNFINALNIGDLISDIFTISLVGCLFLHLLCTKNKRLVTFTFLLVLIQFLNWFIRPLLLEHEYAKYIWYASWMLTDCLILLYVAIVGVYSGKVTRQERDVSFFTLLAVMVYIMRFIERFFVETSIIKVIYPYALVAVNVCIIAVLVMPLIKGLVLLLAEKLNGMTVFGLHIKISAAPSSMVLADAENQSRRKRHYL